MADVGMCGDYNSIIGIDKDKPLTRFLRENSGLPLRAGHGRRDPCALAVETDDTTGLALRVGAVRLAGRLDDEASVWE